jgi:hypothetical protein
MFQIPFRAEPNDEIAGNAVDEEEIKDGLFECHTYSPGHGANSQFGPERPTADPSGQSFASMVQDTSLPPGAGATGVGIGCVGGRFIVGAGKETHPAPRNTTAVIAAIINFFISFMLS